MYLARERELLTMKCRQLLLLHGEVSRLLLQQLEVLIQLRLHAGVVGVQLPQLGAQLVVLLLVRLGEERASGDQIRKRRWRLVGGSNVWRRYVGGNRTWCAEECFCSRLV